MQIQIVMLQILLIIGTLIGIFAFECEEETLKNFVCIEVKRFEELEDYVGMNWQTLTIANKRIGLDIDAYNSPRFKDIEKLDLSGAGQLTLSNGGFQDFKGLKVLNITHSQLEELQGSHFPVRSGIKVLDASYNDILAITKDVVVNLPNLAYANFSNNLIADFEVHAFKSLKDLIFLDMTTNEMVNITLGVVPNLRFLSISNNNLRDFKWCRLRGMPKLEELHLHSNWLEVLDSGIFRTLKSLKSLNLSNNNIEVIRPELFLGSDNAPLQLLDLSSNNIRKLADLFVMNLKNLRTLDLSRNNIEGISSKALIGLSALRVLYLQNNNIQQIGDNAFENLTSLEVLDLSNNKLMHINGNVFGSVVLPKVRYLDFELNNINSLHPLAFSSMPFLEYLSLTRNKLSSLDIRMFAPLRRLSTLKLSRNLIEEISTYVLESLENIRELKIDHNRLTFLPEFNVTFSHLEHVSIEGNPWQCSCFNELIHKFMITYKRQDNAYSSGSKPLCVVTPEMKCIKDLNFARQHELINQYEKAQQQFTF